MTEQRLKGQEVAIRVIRDGVVVNEISAIGSFNDSIDIEGKSDGFLGETTDRFDNVLSGYSGDLDFQVSRASWHEFAESVAAKATREIPNLVFNLVKVENYPDGSSAILTYRDVAFGAIPTNIGSRGDFVKCRLSFQCSERPIQINQAL